MLGKGSQEAFYPPNENACIPEIIATFQESLGLFKRWFFGKPEYFMYFSFNWSFSIIDVTIAGVRAAGLNAQGQECIVFFGKIQGSLQGFHKIGLIEDDVIRRCHHQIGVWVERLQL